MAGAKGRSGTTPNSKKNLKPINEIITPEQQKEYASRAGKASAAKRRERKAMRELIDLIMNTPMKPGEIDEEIGSLAEAKNKNLTVDQMIVLAQVKQALAGNVRSAEFLRDTLGEKPTDKQEITATIKESPLAGILDQLKGDE